MMKRDEYEADRSRAIAARSEAAYLRDLHRTATCGLPMQFVGIHYGTAEVKQSIAMRVADQYLVWAAEYDAIAEATESELEASLTTKEN